LSAASAADRIDGSEPQSHKCSSGIDVEFQANSLDQLFFIPCITFIANFLVVDKFGAH
jgi:hypothetical protein